MTRHCDATYYARHYLTAKCDSPAVWAISAGSTVFACHKHLASTLMQLRVSLPERKRFSVSPVGTS